MSMRKPLLILFVFAIAFSAFAAGTTEQATVQEIRFLFPVQTAGPLANEMESVVDEFNSTHDGIVVNAIFTGNYANTVDRVRTSVMAGNPPHVALIDTPQVLPLYELDAVVDLTEYIESDLPGYEGDFIDGFKRNFEVVDGSVFGLPFQHSVPLMYYNKDILSQAGLDSDQPPMTWEDLIAAGEAIKRTLPEVLPIASPFESHWILQGFVQGNGGAFSEDYATPTLDDAATVEAVQFVYDLIHNRQIAEVRGWGESSEDLLAGDVAMIYNSTGSMGFIRTNATFDWDVAPMPRHGSFQSSFPYGGGGLYLLKGHDAETERAAWEFMKYLTSAEVTARWSIASGYFAVRRSAYDLPVMEDYFEEFPQAERAASFLEFTTAGLVMERMTEFNTIVGTKLEEILILGSTSPEAGLSAAQREVMALY